jgi:DNA-binding transcriptional MocR family regulator
MERLRVTVAAALRQVQAQRQWKPGRALPHLRKRQLEKHLAATATLEAYNQLIEDLVHDPVSLAYAYPVGEQQYYAIRGKREKRE